VISLGKRLHAAFGALICALPLTMAGNPSAPLQWEQLPPIPDAVGFAGSYAGVSQDVLLVAGGANFRGKPPGEGGTKVWHDRIFALERGATAWRDAGRLPQAAGYGVSLSTPEGVLLIGGGDATRNFTDVLRARWNGNAVEFETLPALPVPLAMAAGALLNRTVYVGGGLEQPTSTKASAAFFALNLDDLAAGWKTLPAWPGPARMLATASAQDGAFYLIGGADLSTGPDGKPVRQWLRDAYRFTPGKGWKRLADLPRPSVAAPSPAAAVGQAHVLLLGGDDGSQMGTPPAAHPGFPRSVLAYHVITDTWTDFGSLPFSLVTTTGVMWDGRLVVPGGETRPGVRSTEVWAGRPVRRQAAFGWLNYATLGLYPVVMLGIAWMVGRKRTSEEFFRGGQRIPWWAAGLSIYATMLSSITFMAIQAKSYATDWTFFLANVPVLLLAPVVIAVFLPFFPGATSPPPTNTSNNGSTSRPAGSGAHRS
jgi:SSS family solute:Na+ symporter